MESKELYAGSTPEPTTPKKEWTTPGLRREGKVVEVTQQVFHPSTP
jgi:hypothetical protein